MTRFYSRLAVGCLFLVGIAFFIREVSWNFFAQKRLAQMEHLHEEMENAVAPMVDLYEDVKFFHAFFTEKLERVDSEKYSKKRLKDFIGRLNKAFPGSFEFVVWNEKGEVDAELSQIDGFRYVLKTMLNELQRLKNAVAKKDRRVEEELISTRSLNLLRSFFGQFLLEERLRRFFPDGGQGQAATISESEKRRMFWAYVGKNFSVGVFVNSNILRRRIGPNLILQMHNQKNSLVRIAYFAPCSLRYAGLALSDFEKNEILLEARKFEDFALGFKETSDFLVYFKKASPDLVAISYVRKNGALLDPGDEASRLAFQVFKWLGLLGFFLYVYFLRQGAIELRIKYRLLLLLILANGLPAMVLVAAGYGFFTQKRSVMIFDEQQKSLNMLGEFDLRYLSQNERLANSMNARISALNQKYLDKPWPTDEILALKTFIDQQKPSSYIVLDRNNQEILEKQFKQRLVKIFLIGTLFYVENKLEEYMSRFGSEASTFSLKGFESQAFWFITNNLGNIFPQSFGLDHGYSYTNFLGNGDRSKNWALIVVRWGKSEFLENFCRENLTSFNAEVMPRIAGVIDTNSGKVAASVSDLPKGLVKICRTARIKKIVTKSNFIYAGKEYLLAATSSTNAEDAVFFCLYPMELVQSRLMALRISIIVLLAIVLIVLIQISFYISGRMLAPIDNLQEGLEKIRANEFDCRIFAQENDEIGRVVDLFNSAIGSLKELVLGTAVQESLLPSENFRQGALEIYARSQFMTKMGGDYFDYFAVDAQRVVVFFGDVSGHGIPAAVIMAMVKASILHGSEAYDSPSRLLQKASRVFDFLKSKNYSRTMTACCLEINSATGEFIFSNAGQCFPLIISEDGQKIDKLKLVGMPLGTVSKRSPTEVRATLSCGQAIMIYSDGMIEGRNEEGNFLGLDGFRQLVMNSWGQDLKQNWEKIQIGYQRHCREQNDDLTALVIRYNGN